jgi:uncharacterized repeat protein (TIGR01451 family)
MFLVPQIGLTATTPNTDITNTVSISYTNQPGPALQASTSFFVSDDSPSTIEFLQLSGNETAVSDTINQTFRGAACSPSASVSGPFVNTPVTNLSGQTLIPGSSQSFVERPGAFTTGDILFVQVQDYDQNLNALVAEQIVVTINNSNGDREVIQLFETENSSGVFLGAVQTISGPRSIGNCFLDVQKEDTISASYTDAENNTDSVFSVTLIDPFGVIFDTLDGRPLNGVEVTLIDAGTGLPADVFSPNGIDRWPSTVVSGEDITDSSGTVFPISNGEYRFPRVVAGFYYFEIAPYDDYIFPSSELDSDLQLLPGAPYVLELGSRGETFEVPPGPDVQIDIPFDPIQGELVLEKTVSNTTAAIGDFLAYQISIENPEVNPLSNLIIQDQLPKGFRLQLDSLQLDGLAVSPTTLSADGGTFQLEIGTLGAGDSTSISYVTEITSGTSVGEAINYASSVSRLASSNIAEASVLIKNDLFVESSFLLGQVYEGSCDIDDERIGIRGAKIYLEDGMSITTDSNGRWHVADLQPGTHTLRLDESSLDEGYEVLFCNPNSRNNGTANSTFVNVEPGLIWTHNFVVRRTAEATQNLDLFDSLILDRDFADMEIMPTYDESWLASEDYEILWPQESYTPRYRNIEIAIRHDRSEGIDLSLNGEPVSPLNRRDTVTSPDSPRQITTWAGVDILLGLNQLTIRRLDARGNEISSEIREIYAAGAPYRAEFVPEKSQLIADGRTPAIVAVRLTDTEGYPVRVGTSGRFGVSAPFQGWLPENLRLESNVLTESNLDPLYVTREDGIAYFPIEPTTQTGRLEIEVPFNDGRSEIIEAWLSADARDWILVGLSEGTWGYQEIESNLEPLIEPEEEFYREGRIAFFGKGRVRGDFLMTLAYDSAKQSSDNPDELFDLVEPDQYYSVYGDESQYLNEAQSSRKLFLKIERQQFYALFGDFQTNLSTTELSQYSRSLSGIKSEFKNEYFETNLFASETSLSNLREEIPGNGTAGRYFLERNRIVDFSELVRLEIRDRFQTGEILSESTLARNQDYEIDYDLGTLLFNDPIPTRDEFLNPVFIVVSYETQDDREAALVAGGRAEVSTADDRLELGLSYITEENRGAEKQLAGLDLSYEVTESLEIRSEYATSKTVNAGVADAWSIAADLEEGRLTSGIYMRETQGGFGLGQQNASESGTQKYGATFDLDIGTTYSITASADNQIALDTDSENTQANIEARRVGEKTAVQLGYRWAQTLETAAPADQSELINLSASYQLFSALRIDASTEFSATDKEDSAIFPARDTLGAEWRINNDSAFYLTQERTRGDSATESTQLGIQTALWSGSGISIGVDQSSAAGREQISTVAGLTQRAQLTDNWSLDLKLDQGRDLSPGTPVSGLNPATPPTSGSSGNDYNTGSLGLDWRNGSWAWNNQIEYRQADIDESASVRSGLLKQLDNGNTLIGSMEWFNTQSTESISDDITLSVGYADRSSNYYSLLNRLELNWGEDTTATELIRESKIISNNHLNLTMWEDKQLSAYYGAKYVITNINDTEYSGFTDFIGAQFRQDLSERWDVGLQGSALRSQNSGANRYSYGASVGYSPIQNTWLELGYNLEGFTDPDFDAAAWTDKGVYFSVRYKFDENTVARVANAFNGRPTLDLPTEQVETPVAEATPTPQSTSQQTTSEVQAPIPVPEVAVRAPNIVYSTAPAEQREDAALPNTCEAGTRVRVIQLAAFSELGLTLGMIEFFGFENAFVERYDPEDGGQIVYRLIVGPYTESKTELAEAAAIFEAETGWTPWIKDKDCADLRRVN